MPCRMWLHTITNAAGVPVAVDSSNPSFERRLRESIRLMLSADGYDIDGFKIDFTARIASGPDLHLLRDVWGLATICLPRWNRAIQAQFGLCEIKTFRVPRDNTLPVVETNLLEWIEAK